MVQTSDGEITSLKKVVQKAIDKNGGAADLVKKQSQAEDSQSLLQHSSKKVEKETMQVLFQTESAAAFFKKSGEGDDAGKYLRFQRESGGPVI